MTRGAVRAKLDALVAADRDATRVASILASVLGVAPEPASGDDIAWAVRRTLTLLASERPLVVLVEDIHWAEPALLDLLEAIVDWSHAVPILLLCPARPELLESRADWGAGRQNASILQLEALDPILASATHRRPARWPRAAAPPCALASWARPRATRSSSRNSWPCSSTTGT